jgi:HEAT repeat protein
MWVAHAAFLFLCQAIWRGTRLPSAGRALIRALDSTNANVRTIAGIFLVRAGRRSEPFLEDALRRRQHNLPMLISILADIGDPKAAGELRPFTEDRDPQIAQAARDALRILSAPR